MDEYFGILLEKGLHLFFGYLDLIIHLFLVKYLLENILPDMVAFVFELRIQHLIVAIFYQQQSVDHCIEEFFLRCVISVTLAFVQRKFLEFLKKFADCERFAMDGHKCPVLLFLEPARCVLGTDCVLNVISDLFEGFPRIGISVLLIMHPHVGFHRFGDLQQLVVTCDHGILA